MKKQHLIVALFVIFSQIVFAQTKNIWFSIGDNIFTKAESNNSFLYYYIKNINDTLEEKTTRSYIEKNVTTIKNKYNFAFGFSKSTQISKKWILNYGVGLNISKFVAFSENIPINSLGEIKFIDTIPNQKYTIIFPKKYKTVNNYIEPDKGVKYFSIDLVFPINMSYKFNNLFSLTTGLELSSSLYAKSSYESSVLELVSETKEEILYKFSIKNIVNNNTDAIQRFGVSSLLQGDFSFNPKLNIALGVNYRINNLLLNNHKNGYSLYETNNKYLRFYIKYYYRF